MAVLKVYNGTTFEEIGSGTLVDIVTLTGTQTLTNKTLTTPTIASMTNAQHDHSDAAGGGTLNASAIAAGQLALARGGTNADLSATGGTDQFVTQEAVGVEFSVGTKALANLSDVTLKTGTGTTVVMQSSPFIVGPTISGSIKLNQANSIINDNAGREILTLTRNGTAVNHVDVRNAPTGSDPILRAQGDDTDVGLNLVPKGSGLIQLDGVEIATISGTQTLTNKTLATPTIGDLTNATHDHSNAAGGGTLSLTNLSDVNSATVTSGNVMRADGVDWESAALAVADLSDTKTGTGNIVLATSPTIVTPTIASMTNAQHDHSDAAGGGKIHADYRTVTKMIYIEDPTATDSYPICRVPKASTITEVTGITDVGTVDFNIEERSTADVAGTDLDTTEFVAATTEMSQTSGFENSAIAAKAWLHYAASAVASSPTKVWVTVTYTID